MTIDDWLQRLAPGPLPVFAHTLRELAAHRDHADEVSAREIAHTLLADPLATAHLIHTANHRAGRFGGEVTTAENALMMLGIGRFLDEARQLESLEDGPLAGDRVRIAHFHTLARRVHHAAWQARDFAVLHNDVRAEEVQITAILHALPELLLCLRAPETARRLFRLRRQGDPDAEIQALEGIRLAQLRPPLLEAWKAPELCRDLLDPRLADKPRQAILNACIDIAEHAQRGWWDDSLLGDYLTLAGVDNLPVETVIATAHANATRAERASSWIEVPGAGVWMAMLPGPWPADPEDAETTEPVATPALKPAPPPQPAPPIVKPQPAPAPEPEESHEVCPMPDKAVLRESLQSIEGHLDGSLNLNQMSAIILKGLHSGLSLTRILFAMATPDGKLMKSRFTLGIPPEDPLRHFAFEIGSRDLFGQLMGKMQGVWVNDGNREKLWNMVHPELRKMIGAGDFYAMSLHANGKPIGLIYADRGHGECGLDPHTYTDFKLLCLQAARGLGKIHA
jgi:HD-like signal output (HDOD) protein